MRWQSACPLVPLSLNFNKANDAAVLAAPVVEDGLTEPALPADLLDRQA